MIAVCAFCKTHFPSNALPVELLPRIVYLLFYQSAFCFYQVLFSSLDTIDYSTSRKYVNRFLKVFYLFFKKIFKPIIASPTLFIHCWIKWQIATRYLTENLFPNFIVTFKIQSSHINLSLILIWFTQPHICLICFYEIFRFTRVIVFNK